MAVINGLNAMGSGNTANMSNLGVATSAQKAASAQTKAVTDKVKTLVAVTVDAKPAALPPGEVVKLTNDKGKVEYYVGTYDGKLSKPLTSVSSAVSAVNTQIKKAEAVQATALRTSQKIELNEIKEAAKDAGLTAKEISAITKAETAANTAELKEFNSLLAEPNLQYGSRDPATNALTTSATPSTTPLNSLLTYNDPVIAPTVQANIASARDSVAEFQLLKGVTQPFLPSGNTTSGVNTYAIYQALNNGSIIPTKDNTGITTGYTVSPEVAAAKGDQSGFMDATGMSKASARALGLILNNDVVLGGKANVVVDGKGNYFVNDANGDDRYGTQKPLIDTGRVDGQGNKIFAEVSTDNSKRNLVSVVSNYVQQPDGSFKYAGVDSTDYTHVEGFNPIKALVIAGISAGAGMAAAPLAGLTTTVNGVQVATSAGKTLAGTVAGGLGSALSGSNILKGAALGGLGGFTIGEVQAAAQAAGGYTNLLGQVSSGNFSSFTQAAQDAAAIANSAAASASGVDGGGGGLVGGGESQASINFGDTSVAQGGFPNATNLSNTTVNDYLNSFNLDGTPKTIDLANSGYYTDGTKIIGGGANTSLLNNPDLSNWSNNQSTVENFTGGPATDSGIPGVNPDGTLKQIDLSNSNYYTDGTPRVVTPSGGGLLDTIKDVGSNVVNTLGPLGTVAAGAALVPIVKNALTPKAPAEETYTAPLINKVIMPTNTVPNLVQNYNNLFNRQGVGAGQYLGYDYLNNINVPPELMGLLGTSAQARPTSLTMPTPTSITPA